MPACAIQDCQMNYDLAKKHKIKIAFYRFPKDPELREKWISTCGVVNMTKISNARICSLHFPKEQFERDLYHELTNAPLKLILKKGSIPTINLPATTLGVDEECVNESDIQVSNDEESVKRNNENKTAKIPNIKVSHAKILHIPEENAVRINNTNIVEKVNESKDKVNDDNVLSNMKNVVNQTSLLKASILSNGEQIKKKAGNIKRNNVSKIILSEKGNAGSIIATRASESMIQLETLQRENEERMRIIQQKDLQIVNYRRKIKSLQSERNKLKRKLNAKHKCKCSLYKEAAEELFTPAQLNLILHRKAITRWAPEDISKAFTLRYLSARSYSYVRDVLKYPLPGYSTLRTYATKINMRQGLLTTMINFLAVAGSNMTAEEKLVVLQFDEMKVADVYEYDQENKQSVGPYRLLQLVNAIGLFGKWEQPVYIDFDKKFTSSILHSIINNLHATGFTVVACVCDCGPSNFGLWKELGINYKNVSIKHEKTGGNIYFFADAPHLLKLIRNWLLDSEFTIDNKVISKEPLIQLVSDHSSDEIKLNEQHVTCTSKKRRIVKLASELLSYSTATALKHYYPEDPVAINTAEFIELINGWYDIMSSHESTQNSSAYGVNLEEQNLILNKLYSAILNLRIKNKKGLQLFQKGFLMSINSIKQLYIDIKAKYNAKYILTHRLNQEALQKLFSQIRTNLDGLGDHPTPLHTLKRLNEIILGKSSNLEKNSNMEHLACHDYVITQVLKECNIGVSQFDSKKSKSNKKEIDDDLLNYPIVDEAGTIIGNAKIISEDSALNESEYEDDIHFTIAGEEDIIIATVNTTSKEDVVEDLEDEEDSIITTEYAFSKDEVVEDLTDEEEIIIETVNSISKEEVVKDLTGEEDIILETVNSTSKEEHEDLTDEEEIIIETVNSTSYEEVFEDLTDEEEIIIETVNSISEEEVVEDLTEPPAKKLKT